MRLTAVLALFVVLTAAAVSWYMAGTNRAETDNGKSKIKGQPEQKAGAVAKTAPVPARPQYHIKATLDERACIIRGEVELTTRNPGTEKLLFYAYPPWNQMRITTVMLNGKAVQYEFEGKNLTFPNKPGAGEIRVRINFETPVPRAGTRFGVKDNTWLITTWYPMLGVMDKNRQWIKRPDPRGMGDPFYFDYADYRVEWTSPAEIKWVTSGAMQAEREVQQAVQGQESGKSDRPPQRYRTTVWEVDQVRNFALVGSPDYIIRRFKLNENTTVSIALTEASKMEEVLEIARHSYPLFTKIYGELPYSEVAVAETGHNTNYALEYPNLAIYSRDMYRNDKIQHWVTHEIGHNWWYNAVGNHETVDGWLDEGLVEHGVVWYLEKRFSKERGSQLWNQYRAEHKRLIGQHPQRTMDVGLYGFKDFREFDYSWYSRSADMFLTMRQALGDDEYIKFLNALYANNIGKTIGEKELNAALDASLGLKTDFFALWLHRPYEQTTWSVNFEKE